MSGSGVCPTCTQPIEDHDNAERKRCHDAVSGYHRSNEPTASVAPSPEVGPAMTTVREAIDLLARTQPRDDALIRSVLGIDPDVDLDTHRLVAVPKDEPCGSCRGKGRWLNYAKKGELTWEPCPSCNGTGVRP